MKVILVCWSYLILWYLRFNQELGKCYWVFASSWELASVGLRSKESQRNGIFGVLPARKMVREPKRGMRGRGRRSKETLADKPLDFEDLPFPPPPPSFVFGSRPPFFAREKHRKSRSSVFLCSHTPRKRLLRWLVDNTYLHSQDIIIKKRHCSWRYSLI